MLLCRYWRTVQCVPRRPDRTLESRFRETTGSSVFDTHRRVRRQRGARRVLELTICPARVVGQAPPLRGRRSEKRVSLVRPLEEQGSLRLPGIQGSSPCTHLPPRPAPTRPLHVSSPENRIRLHS